MTELYNKRFGFSFLVKIPSALRLSREKSTLSHNNNGQLKDKTENYCLLKELGFKTLPLNSNIHVGQIKE